MVVSGDVRAVVPAYFHPAVDPDAWELLAQRAAQVRAVVLNVTDGPGDKPDSLFGSVVRRLVGAGVGVAGYVDTNYGRRRAEEVLAELEHYVDWYGISGVAFDQVSSDAGCIGYYTAVAERARLLGAELVIFNHGVPPVEAYAEHADLLGTFEGPWRAYATARMPRWVRSWPADQFYHLVYSVPPARLSEACALVARRHVGGAFVTDRGGDNPWDYLPANLFDCLGR